VYTKRTPWFCNALQCRAFAFSSFPPNNLQTVNNSFGFPFSRLSSNTMTSVVGDQPAGYWDSTLISINLSKTDLKHDLFKELLSQMFGHLSLSLESSQLIRFLLSSKSETLSLDSRHLQFYTGLVAFCTFKIAHDVDSCKPVFHFQMGKSADQLFRL
jgi:hypothetical protein